MCLGPLEQFENWLSTFRLEEMKGEISELLVNSPSIRALYTKMVSFFFLQSQLTYFDRQLCAKEFYKNAFTILFSPLGSCGCCSFRILAEIFLQSLSVRSGSNIYFVHQNALTSSRCLCLHLVDNWRKNKNKHVKWQLPLQMCYHLK